MFADQVIYSFGARLDNVWNIVHLESLKIKRSRLRVSVVPCGRYSRSILHVEERRDRWGQGCYFMRQMLIFAVIYHLDIKGCKEDTSDAVKTYIHHIFISHLSFGFCVVLWPTALIIFKRRSSLSSTRWPCFCVNIFCLPWSRRWHCKFCLCAKCRHSNGFIAFTVWSKEVAKRWWNWACDIHIPTTLQGLYLAWDFCPGFPELSSQNLHSTLFQLPETCIRP